MVFDILHRCFVLPFTTYILWYENKIINIYMLFFIFVGLSLVDTVLMEVITGIVLATLLFVLLVNYMQEHHQKKLPRVLRDWKFLPKPLRTLETIDYVVQTYMEVCTIQSD